MTEHKTAGSEPGSSPKGRLSRILIGLGLGLCLAVPAWILGKQTADDSRREIRAANAEVIRLTLERESMAMDLQLGGEGRIEQLMTFLSDADRAKQREALRLCRAVLRSVAMQRARSSGGSGSSAYEDGSFELDPEADEKLDWRMRKLVNVESRLEAMLRR